MKVVVCTPTKNRKWAWEFSNACMETQLHQPVKWIVVDNSTDPEQDWSISKTHPLVSYVKVEGVQPIGSLRNRCLEEALAYEWDVLVFWDDDDYYPPTRISSGVKALTLSPEADIAGSSKMYLFLTRENVMLTTGPFHDKHATAATFTIRRRYIEANRFDGTKERAEEPTFTKNWSAKLVQVSPEDTIVVLGHGRNTVDKSDLLKRPQMYNATILNADNGKQVLRSRWPVPWDLFRRTFSV